MSQGRLLASLKSEEDDWTVLFTSLATLYSVNISVKWAEYHMDFVKHRFLRPMVVCDMRFKYFSI